MLSLVTPASLTLLVTGVLALSTLDSAPAAAGGYGHDRGGHACSGRDYHAPEEDFVRRHDCNKRQHYRRVQRFNESLYGPDRHPHRDRRYGRRHDRHAGDYRHRDDYRHGDDYVCDPDGDRCYRSSSPYWSYREYYRRHGYKWRNGRD